MSFSLSKQKSFLESWRRLASTGAGADRCVELLLPEATDPVSRARLNGLRSRLQAGQNLKTNRAVLEEVFDPAVAAILVAGEEGGCLDRALDFCGAHLERWISLRRKLLLAMAYPAFLTVAACVIVPVPTIFSEGLGTAILRYYLPMAGAVLGAALVLYFLVRRWRGGGEGRLSLEKLILRLPVVGALLRDLGAGLFLSVCGSLLESGVSLATAVREGCKACGVASLASRGGELSRQAAGGTPLSKILPQAELFGQETLRHVIVGEETGKLAEACREQADQAHEAVQSRGTQLALVVAFLMIGLVVLAIIAHVLLFWVDYFQRVSKAGM